MKYMLTYITKYVQDPYEKTITLDHFHLYHTIPYTASSPDCCRRFLADLPTSTFDPFSFLLTMAKVILKSDDE